MIRPKKRLVKGGKSTGRWEVDFGIDEIGVRRRPTFTTEAEADAAISTWGKETKNHGEFWARLPVLERKSIAVVYQEIRLKGLSLAQVWSDHQRWAKELQQVAKEVKAYEDVVTEWTQRKRAAGKDERYIKEASALLLKFGQGHLRQPIHEIRPKELEEWINGHPSWGQSSKKTNTSLFSSLWDVAVKMGWCSYNVCDRLEPNERPGQAVKVYSNEQTMNYMAALLDNELTKKVIAPIALQAFGCMRPEEISEPPAKGVPFGWHDIDLKHGLITVRPECAKVGDQRVIRLRPVAIEWLKLAQELKNPLPPINERRLVDMACELIGMKEWLRDGWRKNCATHLRNHYRNDYDVIKDMGNSIRILLKSYADLHTPEEVSAAYWKIGPKAVADYRKTAAWKNVLQAAAPQDEQEANAHSNPGAGVAGG